MRSDLANTSLSVFQPFTNSVALSVHLKRTYQPRQADFLDSGCDWPLGVPVMRQVAVATANCC